MVIFKYFILNLINIFIKINDSISQTQFSSFDV